MVNSVELMQLCRLCLVKDQVNIPIFEDKGEAHQIFLKISACLPVKVSREDNLPKKICNDCSYKLDLFYQFWNTSVNSEKQLLAWLNEISLNQDTLTDGKMQKSEVSAPGLVLKQEAVELESDPQTDSNNMVSNEAQDYLLQQQQLPYQPPAFPYSGEGKFPGAEVPAGSSVSNTVTTNNTEEDPPSQKRKRKATATVTQPDSEEDEDDDDDGIDAVETKVAKTEETSDDDRDDDGIEDQESTSFAGMPSTSTDNEQPGPSGMGKAVTEAPLAPLVDDSQQEASQTTQTVYECEVCTQIFASKKEFLGHHMSQFGETFNCCRCNISFNNTDDLYQHYEVHKNEALGIDNEGDSVEFDCSENVEAVMNIPNETISDANELLYILDDSQCVNEVVIEEVAEMHDKTDNSSTKADNNYTIVQVEHGYVLPSVFKGQLQPKRRYVKKDNEFISIESQSDIENENSLLMPVKIQSTTAKRVYAPKPRQPQPKRRHEVPDFSATSYIVLNPNDEVDIPHYKCLRCEQLFINKFVFFRHIEKGKCYINSCDVCSATFSKNSEFYDHYVIEHTDRAICNFCFRTFMYEKNVKEHMLRHLDQFRHRCEECNKGFYTIREYRNHYKNRHMGIRHKCEVCSRSFADEYYFKRHVATHERALHK